MKTYDDMTLIAEQVLVKQRDAKWQAIQYLIESWKRLVKAQRKHESWYRIRSGLRCNKCNGVILERCGPFTYPTIGGYPIVGCPKCGTIWPKPIDKRKDIREEKMNDENVPRCCGEPMTPSYRYRAKDGIHRTFVCEKCGSKREVKDTKRVKPDSFFNRYGEEPGEDM